MIKLGTNLKKRHYTEAIEVALQFFSRLFAAIILFTKTPVEDMIESFLAN